MSDFWQTIFAVVLFALIAAVAYGHPGALDDSNCHRVQQDYKYQSGKVLKKGSYHCHGRLNDLALDGRNMIEDEKGEKKESKDKQK
jgi:hypothetical protein